jgi:hypothetical protein
MISKEESLLLNTLKQEINRVISFVSRREQIHNQREGRITISFPSEFERSKEVIVTLDSYIMSSFDLRTSWSNAKLKTALLEAIHDIQLWYKMEKESPSLLILDRIGGLE